MGLKLMLLPLLILTMAGAGQAGPRPLIVDADQFKCLTEKLRTVPNTARGVYVDISKCRSKGLMIVQNVFQPMPSSRPDGVETLIYLKPSYVQCIRKNRTAISRIADPAGGGRLRLKLDPCGG